MESPLACLEIGAARDEADLSVILMHGLGATSDDFSDVAMALSQAAKPRKWRFVLPQAPNLPVTINMGMSMPAWYDILDLSQPRQVNWDTVETTHQSIDTLISSESRTSQIVLAGFSQGAAMALHVGLRQSLPIAGILMMSGYLLESEAHPCPSNATDIPIAIYHGSDDAVVPLQAAKDSMTALSTIGYQPSFKVYDGMEHSVCDEEIHDVYGWLNSLSKDS